MLPAVRRLGAESFYPAAGGPLALIAGGGAAWGAPVLLFNLAQNFYYASTLAVSSALSNLDWACVQAVQTPPGTTPWQTRETIPLFNPGPATVAFTDLAHAGHPSVALAATAVSLRATHAAAGNPAVNVWTLGWMGAYPAWDTIPAWPLSTAATYLPSDNAVIGYNVPAPGAWAYGASVTVLASCATDILVDHAIIFPNIGALMNPGFFLQIGYGPAGLETWCATVAFANTIPVPTIYPPVHVKAGERLALRGAAGIPIALLFLLHTFNVP